MIISKIRSLIVFTVSSWILIHVFAVFGIFLAVAYPAWRLFIPKRSFCLICMTQRTGGPCRYCKNQNNLTAALINGAIILLLCVVSIGIVYGESRILFLLGFRQTLKSATFTIPSKGQYRLGEIFSMKMELNNLETAVNAIQADVGFDPDRVEVVDISTAGSFANIFIQKEINNTAGWLRLTGGLPNPGYLGESGDFGTIFFRAKSPGIVKIGFLSTSLVLANDGRGTNILKSLPSVSYLILPQRITEVDERRQRQLISEANVLGTSTPSGQLIFFEDTKR